MTSFTRPGIELKSTVLVLDALSTRPLIGLIEKAWILSIILRFVRSFAAILFLFAKTFVPFDAAFLKPNMAALRLGMGQICSRNCTNKLIKLAEYTKLWCLSGTYNSRESDKNCPNKTPKMLKFLY